MANSKSGELNLLSEVRDMLREARELLSDIIDATKAADEKAKQRGADLAERHRLHVLLECAEINLNSLPQTVIALWRLAELKATLGVIRKWKKRPHWEDIEACLKDPHSFTHDIARLHLADHLERAGQKVELVPRGRDASPDLVVYAIGGSGDKVFCECYQPIILSEPSKLFADEAENVVENAMDKAKRQLDPKSPGFIAICGYNQVNENVRALTKAGENRLSKTPRTNLCGILLTMLDVLMSEDYYKLRYRPVITAVPILNPSYFGKVGVDTSVPENHPGLVRGTLIDVRIDWPIPGIVKQLSPEDDTAIPRRVRRPKATKETNLSVIEKPQQLTRVVVHGVGDRVPPLFVGDGNINYLCGHCGTTLAECIWAPSISNVVVG